MTISEPRLLEALKPYFDSMFSYLLKKETRWSITSIYCMLEVNRKYTYEFDPRIWKRR